MSISPVLYSSKDETHETPQALFDALNNVFHFDLDVCALPESAKCKRYFTPEPEQAPKPRPNSPEFDNVDMRIKPESRNRAAFHLAKIRARLSGADNEDLHDETTEKIRRKTELLNRVRSRYINGA